MSFRCLLFAVVLVLQFCTRAADTPPAFTEPEHLQPVNPYPDAWLVRYTNQLRSRFKLDFPHSFFFAQMLVMPSFTPEYVVQLRDAKGEQDIAKAEKLLLTYSVADKSIWSSMPENRQFQKDKKQQRVNITVKTVEFPKPLAAQISQLWKRMLHQTRYEFKDAEGADGTTYEFGVWRAYGETWSPHERKSPLLLVEIGESLIGYCKAAPADRPAAEKEIENRAALLEKYLNEHTSK